MLSLSKPKSIVGLDVETGSIAATELHLNGGAELAGWGTMPLDPGVFREGEVADAEGLGAGLKELFGKHKLSKNVRLGITNQRVAVRTLRLPRIPDHEELETAIRFQAQDHIPMPLEQAVLDWQVVPSPLDLADETQMSVVVVAARRDMLEAMLDALRLGGLRPVGIDHSAFGMIRALGGERAVATGASAYIDAPTAAADALGGDQALPSEAALPAEDPSAPAAAPAELLCSLGDITSLAVARGRTCLFTRTAAFGVEGMAQTLAERRQLSLEHARQWLVHVGLTDPLESIEGDRDVVAAARDALVEGASKLVDELRLSLEFYGAQQDAVPVEGIVTCGIGSTIPGLVARIEQGLGQPVEVARPEALSQLGETDAARLSLSYGLALEA